MVWEGGFAKQNKYKNILLPVPFSAYTETTGTDEIILFVYLFILNRGVLESPFVSQVPC